MTAKVSLKEAAFILGVHWRTVYRWTLEGAITYIQSKINSKIYIPESEIERLCMEKSNASKIKFVIYFIQAGDGGLIKIGMTNSIKNRFDALQLESPIPLKILATTDKISENQMHERLARYRKHGEWFEPAEELLQFIEKLKTDTN